MDNAQESAGAAGQGGSVKRGGKRVRIWRRRQRLRRLILSVS